MTARNGSTPESGRLSAGRSQPSADNLNRGKIGADFVQDSVTRKKTKKGRGRYLTKTRVQATLHELTGKDRAVIELLANVPLASGAQIRRLVWGDGQSVARQARRQLAKLTNQRVIGRQSRRVPGTRSSDGYVYCLDVVGQKVTGATRANRRPREIGHEFIDHTLAIAECYLTLRSLADQQDIELVHFEAEPRCWRDFVGHGGARQVLKPDAYMISAVGDYLDHWFIEMDRATESPSRIKRKAETYVSYFLSGREQDETGLFPRVLWVVPDLDRMDALIEALGRLPAEGWQMFRVTTMDAFASTISKGAGNGEEVSL
jgi:hypothetical protein